MVCDHLTSCTQEVTQCVQNMSLKGVLNILCSWGLCSVTYSHLDTAIQQLRTVCAAAEIQIWAAACFQLWTGGWLAAGLSASSRREDNCQALVVQRNFLNSCTRFLCEFQQLLVIDKSTSPPAAFVKSCSSPLCAAMIVAADPMAHAWHIGCWIHSGANVNKLCAQCSCGKTALCILRTGFKLLNWTQAPSLYCQAILQWTTCLKCLCWGKGVYCCSLGLALTTP